MNQHRKEGSRGSSLFLKIISFDLFFQGSEYGMSKCIASYSSFRVPVLRGRVPAHSQNIAS